MKPEHLKLIGIQSRYDDTIYFEHTGFPLRADVFLGWIHMYVACNPTTECNSWIIHNVEALNSITSQKPCWDLGDKLTSFSRTLFLYSIHTI